MFGFSLQKLVILVTIVAAVWYGFKLVKRLQDARELEARRQQGDTRPKTKAWPWSREPTGKTESRDAEQMVRCPVCDTYVPAHGTTNCKRPSCPY